MTTVHACPICGTALNLNPRYPRCVCDACVAKAVAPNGRPLSFSNLGASGGYSARYADNGAKYLSHDCLISGVRCRADEAHFGGIVVEIEHRRGKSA